MIKLFLVEDEKVMREGIKKHIDWEKEGIEFVGEGSDGEVALPLILEKKPDIVITDIKMPFMNGLVLSERIRKELPDTKIIILSGYDEFSYAQDAIRIGVTEYLLKPITPAALLESIKTVADQIRKERAENDALPEETALGEPASADTKNPLMDTEAAGVVSGKELEEFLRTGASPEADTFMEGIFASIGEQNAKSLLFLNYLTMDMYFTMSRFLKELTGDAQTMDRECGDINDIVRNMTEVSEAKDYLTRCLKRVISIRDQLSVKRYGKVMREAVAYIDEHYADEDISLNTLALLLSISPNHFSAIFSQEMGVTFIEYLIGKRMEKAKELLMTTDMKSFEVAYAVGYKDPHYFSSTFKKTQGMTTREYRLRGSSHE
ncbi:MAG: response regulator [Lachnospiraceae bacterium]|nr:response regulator [Lachnospiraceae bacterium]